MNHFPLKKIYERQEGAELLEFCSRFEYPKKLYRNIYTYNGVLRSLRDPSFLAHVLSMKESVQSSSIEGAITTISDILEAKMENELSETRKRDIIEVLNYEQAMDYAILEMKDKKDLSEGFIKNIQSILLDSTRGYDKRRGDYKIRDNAIGSRNGDVTYMPPSFMKTKEYMEDLFLYINNALPIEIDPVIKVAIIHAQFELIHPFEDGNGRTGRILIPLLLYKYEVTENPYFYMSNYFAQYRNEYLSSLGKISQDNDWSTWIEFFLKGINSQAEYCLKMLDRLENIRREVEKQIMGLKTSFSIEIVNFLFTKIKFNTPYFIKKTGISESTAKKLLSSLVEVGVISVVLQGSGKRATQYVFTELYRIIEEMDNASL